MGTLHIQSTTLNKQTKSPEGGQAIERGALLVQRLWAGLQPALLGICRASHWLDLVSRRGLAGRLQRGVRRGPGDVRRGPGDDSWEKRSRLHSPVSG